MGGLKMKFNDFLNEQLKDGDFKKEYDKLTPEYEIVAAIIKARNDKGLTQLELAKIISSDQSRISRLEKGTLNPSLNFLKKIADALGQELHISFVPK